MGKKLISVKTVVAIGIGAALFFVLFRFVTVPSGIPNTNLNLGIAILAFFAAVFGPLAGLLIGFIGHTLTDLTWGGVWWSWVVSSALFGCAVGALWKFYKIEEGGFGVKQCLVFNAVQIVANFLVWSVIAPTLDILIYQEPADKVYLQGLIAAALNSGVILILGSVWAYCYSKTRPKTGSLKAEEKPSEDVPKIQALPESKFDGGVLELVGISILGFLLTLVTLGICFPLVVCWFYKWQINHTIIEGRRLKFHGRAVGLFGTWLICWLLCIITLGIYGFWVPIRLEKWKVKNVTFAE